MLHRTFIKQFERVSAAAARHVDTRLADACLQDPTLATSPAPKLRTTLRGLVRAVGVVKHLEQQSESSSRKRLAAALLNSQAGGRDLSEQRPVIIARRRSTGEAMDSEEMKRMMQVNTMPVIDESRMIRKCSSFCDSDDDCHKGSAAFKTIESDVALVSNSLPNMNCGSEAVKGTRQDHLGNQLRECSKQALSQQSRRKSIDGGRRSQQNVAGDVPEFREQQQRQQQQQQQHQQPQCETPTAAVRPASVRRRHSTADVSNVGALEKAVTWNGSTVVPVVRERRKSVPAALAVGPSAFSTAAQDLALFSPYVNASSFARKGRQSSKAFSGHTSGSSTTSGTATTTSSNSSRSSKQVDGSELSGVEQGGSLPSLERPATSRTTRSNARKLSLLVPSESGRPCSTLDLAEAYGPWLADKDLCMTTRASSCTPRGSSISSRSWQTRTESKR